MTENPNKEDKEDTRFVISPEYEEPAVPEPEPITGTLVSTKPKVGPPKVVDKPMVDNTTAGRALKQFREANLPERADLK